MLKNILYKFLVLFFYYIGEVACRIDAEWAGDLYLKTMKLSLKWDEKLDFWWWKEAPLNKENNL